MRIPHPAKRMRRVISTLLLLYFVWDFGVDWFPRAHIVPDSGRGFVLLAGGSQTPPADSDPDCGFPDHQSALTHHHHFPGVIAAEAWFMPVAIAGVAEHTVFLRTGHAPVSFEGIRGPPAV